MAGVDRTGHARGRAVVRTVKVSEVRVLAEIVPHRCEQASGTPLRPAHDPTFAAGGAACKRRAMSGDAVGQEIGPPHI